MPGRKADPDAPSARPALTALPCLHLPPPGGAEVPWATDAFFFGGLFLPHPRLSSHRGYLP